MQFHNSTFAHAIVALDGNDYDHCDFRHCILVYRGGTPPRFAHCSFLQSPFRFEDAAGNTLSFMASLYHGGFKTYVEQTFKKICTDRRGRRRATEEKSCVIAKDQSSIDNSPRSKRRENTLNFSLFRVDP